MAADRRPGPGCMAVGRGPGPGRAGVAGMSRAAPDLIAGYLAELCAGLRVPAADAELIVAEAEDHLRETATAGLAIGMTEREAQEAAISSFGPVRAVVRARRRRGVTAADAAMAVWKLAGLLAATVGAGGRADRRSGQSGRTRPRIRNGSSRRCSARCCRKARSPAGRGSLHGGAGPSTTPASAGGPHPLRSRRALPNRLTHHA